MKTYISHIMSSLEEKLHTSTGVATEFRSFYEGLYNLVGSSTQDSPLGEVTTQVLPHLLRHAISYIVT